MTWKIETVTIGDRQYVSGCHFVAERRGPESDLEMDQAFVESLLDERGKLQWALDANPDFGKELPDGTVDRQRYMIVRAPQPDTSAEVAERERQARKAKIAAALPDILLAVAGGAELKEELRKVLEVQRE
jgi:hypothetical protein